MTGPSPLSATPGMREHPLRRAAVGEMHLRRWPSLTAPTLVIQWLRTCSEEERAAQRTALLDAAGLQIDHGARPGHLSGTAAPGIRFTWESHSEATSFTLFVADAPPEWLDGTGAPDALVAMIALGESLIGAVIRATRMWVGADDAAVDVALAAVRFRSEELVSCAIGAGARMWSDFRIQADGYGRMLLAANGTTGGELARLAQRLQELGNYRNLALIGLPLAKEHWPRLDAIEVQLEALSRDQRSPGTSDDELLERLSDLSLDLMSIATATGFRLSATAAYAQLVEDRLNELTVEALPGAASLVDFTERRFLPAVRTCAALSRRERQLSLRVTQFTSLLRTRVETRIENQNGRLLASMERSASMQLRLQQLVEGLSVVALSYYLLGLVSYLLKGLEHIDHRIDTYLIVAVLTLPVIFTTWAVLHWVKGRVLR